MDLADYPATHPETPLLSIHDKNFNIFLSAYSPQAYCTILKILEEFQFFLENSYQTPVSEAEAEADGALL
jgi:hypothetical protein